MDSAKKKAKTIDEYLANAKPDHRKTLQKLRQTIQTAAPNAEECISYGIPAFRLNRRLLVFFGAWANHCAFYPGSAAALKNFRNELSNFKTGKGTIRFSPDKPLPVTLVKKLVKARIGEDNDRANKQRSSQQKKEKIMSTVRVLVGTRKGAFILTSDGTRKRWKVSGPHFAGWEMYHMKASPVDSNRIYASQTSGWFGQIIQRSDDGGKTWNTPGSTPEELQSSNGMPKAESNKFIYDTSAETGKPITTHQWYDGTQHPWEFKRVWHLEPSLNDSDHVYAGVEDAAIFESKDGGKSWHELAGLRGSDTGPKWQPGAGGMCLHTILLDPKNPQRMYIAISAAGAFRTEDGGKTWKPINRGLHSPYIPDPTAEVGHCVHRIAMHPSRPHTLFMQKHWDVMRSDDAGGSWHEVSGNLPSDFGFPIDVHAHEPETIYVVPIKSDSEHYPPSGRLRVYRSRTGGNDWEALTKGLPQRNCYVNVLRDAMSVDSLDPCGVYFGTTGGQVYASANAGDKWKPIVRDLPAVLSVEAQTLP